MTFLVDINGESAVVKDALGQTSELKYDQNGQLVKVTPASPDRASTSLGYDSRGNVDRVTDELGNTSFYTTDPESGGLRITRTPWAGRPRTATTPGAT